MTLDTARLRLRDLAPADAAFMLTLLNEPSFVDNIGDRGVRTLGDARAYIETGPIVSYARHGFGLYHVELRASGAPIGICGLLRRGALPDPDLGFAFLPAYWRQGYAFESASAVRDYARAELRVGRLLAITSPANAASIGLLGRLGFRFDRMTRLTPDGVDLNLYVDEGAPDA